MFVNFTFLFCVEKKDLHYREDAFRMILVQNYSRACFLFFVFFLSLLYLWFSLYNTTLLKRKNAG